MQIQISISSCYIILTPGLPVPALTLLRETPGKVAAGVPILKSVVWLDLEIEPRSADLETDALTTRPTRPYALRESAAVKM